MDDRYLLNYANIYDLAITNCCKSMSPNQITDCANVLSIAFVRNNKLVEVDLKRKFLELSKK